MQWFELTVTQVQSQESNMQIFITLFHADAHILLLFFKGEMSQEQSTLKGVSGCFRSCKSGGSSRCTRCTKAGPEIIVAARNPHPRYGTWLDVRKTFCHMCWLHAKTFCEFYHLYRHSTRWKYLCIHLRNWVSFIEDLIESCSNRMDSTLLRTETTIAERLSVLFTDSNHRNSFISLFLFMQVPYQDRWAVSSYTN